MSDFIIHYHTRSTEGIGKYDGTDILDTEDEFNARLIFRAREGWNLSAVINTVPKYAIMTMEVRS